MDSFFDQPGPTPPPQPDLAPDAEQEISGAVARITFSNKDTGYSVIRLEPLDPGQRFPLGALSGEGVLTLVGVMPGIEAGQQILAGGQWVRDQKYGPQFKVTWFKPQIPTGHNGMVAYLACGSVKGLGPVMAERIVARFGDKTFEVMDGDIEQLRKIPGIGAKMLDKIKEGWSAARGDRELITFLGDHGIAPWVAARLRSRYENNALAMVRANPYCLTEVRGFGFQRADAIARKIGISPDAPERIQAALMHVLAEQSDEGHTCVARPRLEDLAQALIQVPAEAIQGQLEGMLALGHNLRAEPMDPEPFIFLRTLHEAEQQVAANLIRLTRSVKRLPQVDPVSALADCEQRFHFHLARAQREACLTLANHGMMILTGGPGTGKTTTVRAIIELFRQGYRSIKLAAPTGRAARRLSETSGMPAETLHRLLGFQAHQGDFTRNRSNPVEADLVIVDEVSMLDVQLADALLQALSDRCCLMLVGDEDQLPSVGPGNVLGDLISSGAMPVVRLTEIFRQVQSSLIVTNAHRLNHGHMPHLTPPEGVAEPDFFFIERDEPQQVIETIRTLVCERIPRKFGLDPKSEIQILTPMRKGELGVEALNALLKQWINVPGGAAFFDENADPQAAARRLRQLDVDDRVMQTYNNYDKLTFNGDIGRVTFVDAQSGEVHIDFDGRAVSYTRDELDQLTLAYATTIHKSQGSEYPAVIVPVHTTHWIMLQRNLIYTALTRARRLVCLVGTSRALRRAVGNATRATRSTGLLHFYAQQTGTLEPGQSE